MVPDQPLSCSRCGTALAPGAGDLHVVKIVAVADPFPPVFSGEDMARDIEHEVGVLLARLRGVSDQESMDQVYRGRIDYLCGRCLRRWIDDPFGTS